MNKPTDVFFETIQQVNDFYGVPTLHPLVTVVHVDSRNSSVGKVLFHHGLFSVWLKETKGCSLSYGRTPYDFDEMTVTSFEPGQVVTVETVDPAVLPKCVGLFFHPDFIKRTSLGQNISRYEFFGYNSTEALHLSAQEVDVFRQVVGMIEQELQRPIDKHSRELIVSNIELLLNYCLRFYDRQFITREELNHSVVIKFTSLLKGYIAQQAETEGLPTVAYFAGKCCLSTGYFSSLVKAETGRTAKDLINERLLASAKGLLCNESL